VAFNNVTQSVASAFETVGQFILDGIENLLVPDQEFINEKIGLVKEKFAFVDNIKTVWQSVSTLVEDGEEQIPQITVDFSKAEGKYNYGGTSLVLDMSWYSRYKPFVDGIIIGFSYLSFAFLVFKRLPEIISGSGAITDTVSKGGKK